MIFKLNKKKIVRFSILAIVICFLVYVGFGIADYLEYKSVVKASAGMSWQDGGKISMVREPCVLDTPASDPVVCGISCPLVTSVWGSGCVGYIEIDTVGQLGTTFISAPVGFVYSGGGAHPRAGMDFIAGGATNAMPWVIGIPGYAANNIDKIVDWFDKYIIASFKDKEK